MSDDRGPESKAAPRAVYLCAGPDCCTREEGVEAWKHLKRRLKERGLAKGPRAVKRAKVECFGVCGDGPIAFVHPERTWYAAMGPARIDRVIEEHLIGGRPVADFAFEPPDDARDPTL